MSNHRNMIRLPFRLTKPLGDELSQTLIKKVETSVETTHPDVIKQDAISLGRMRGQLSGHSLDVSAVTLSSLISYYAQLSFVMTKFADEIGIEFEWYPAFSSYSPSSTPLSPGGFPSAFATSDAQVSTSFSSERLSILYNIAAMFVSLALESSPKDEEAFKAAIAGLQNAAGALEHLRELLTNDEASKAHASSNDWTVEAVNSLRDLCLAQAQELFWQKAVMGRLKNGTVAKLAAKVAELYTTSLDTAKQAKPTLPDTFLNYLQIKALHFEAVAQYRKSVDDLGANRYGDELGRLEVAQSTVKRALAAPKAGISDSVINDLKSLQAILVDNKARAVKDNDLIYLHAVTPPSSLPPIVPATMVKPTTIPELLTPISYLHAGAGGLGRPLFDQLVPIEVHLAVSVYDDRKEQLLREQVIARKDELDGFASATLGSLGLPGSIQAATNKVGLPPSLVDQARRIRAEGGVSRIKQMLTDVRKVGVLNQNLLDQSNEILRAEQAEDDEARARYGTDRWTRISSAQAAEELRGRINHFSAIVESARTSDGLVRGKFAQAESSLKVLSGDETTLQNAVPSLSTPLVSFAANGAGPVSDQTKAMRALSRAIDELDDLRSIRTRIVSEAKQTFASDDIRPAVMNHAGVLSSQSKGAKLTVAQFEDLFQAHLQSLSRFEVSMTENGTRQDEVLERIKGANEAFLAARRTDPALAEREAALQQLDRAAQQHHELLANLQEGLKFYDQLSQLLTELRENAKQFAYARSEEAKELGVRIGLGGVRISGATLQPGTYDPSRGPIRFG